MNPPTPEPPRENVWSRVPHPIDDVDVASDARIYERLLGGTNHYPPDCLAYEELLRIAPGAARAAYANRDFMTRVVTTLARAGVRQFLDLGCGMLRHDAVHTIARRIDPSTRVVYLDRDPSALAHAGMRLDQNDRTRVVRADITDPGLMCNREVTTLIDYDQPTAVLLIGVMHCLPDDVADRLIPSIARWLTPTSYIAVSHLVSPHDGIRRDVTALMRRVTEGQWGRVRDSNEVGAYLEDQDLLMPGLCDVNLWNPDPRSGPLRDSGDLITHGGVAVLVDRTR